MFRQGKALVPSFTAFAVTKLLREHFGDFVDTDFTAEMEEDLDEISRGEREWLDFLSEFYRGDKQAPRALHGGQRWRERRRTIRCSTSAPTRRRGEPVRVRIGRFGPFVQRG